MEKDKIIFIDDSIEDSDKSIIILEDSEESKNVPHVVESEELSLTSSKEEILDAIQKVKTKEELDALEELFKISLAKKELARVATQDELLDALLEQAKKRIAKSGELSNKDLLDYYNAFDSMVARSSSKKKTDEDSPSVLINQTKNDVTINVADAEGLSRESQNRAMEVVKAILEQAKQNQSEAVDTSDEQKEEVVTDD